MAKLPSAFNQKEHDDMMDFSLLPVDVYTAAIMESSMEETKDKTGEYLKLEVEIIEGKFKGRKIWRNLNLINKNDKAVQIAQEELATICRACGITGTLTDSKELHNVPMSIKVGIRKGKNDNPDQNVINKYLPLEGAAKPARPGKQSKADEEAVPAGKTSRKRRPIFEDDNEEEEAQED